MTKNNDPISINTSAKGGAVTNLLVPRHTPKDRDRFEKLRSRINVARAILAARVERGLTQGELGKIAGTKQSRVSEIEAMKGNPRLETLDRVARPLGLMVTLVSRDAQGLLPKGYRGKYEASTKYTVANNPSRTATYIYGGAVSHSTVAASGAS